MYSTAPHNGIGKIARLASRVTSSTPLSGLSLHVVSVGVRDFVTILGSLPGGIMHVPGNRMVARVFAAMLLEGTKKRSKAVFHEELERRGIQLSFSVDSGSLSFHLRTLTSELPAALSMLVEAIMQPALSQFSLDSVKKRLSSQLQELKSDPHDLAMTRFVQKLYPRGHKNWIPETDEAIVALRKVFREDLIEFSKACGLGYMRVVAVGDVDHRALERTIREAWQSTKKGDFPLFLETQKTLLQKASEATIFVPGKASVDVFVGSSLPMSRKDPEYYAVSLAISVLGSGFTGRLMKHVRARDGLTYHTRAQLSGIANEAQGYWFAYASFAPELYNRGKASLLHEVAEFATHGITKEELAHRKSMLAGKYCVSLSTTDGLANAILSILQEDLPLALLDEYTQKFNDLNLDEVNEVITKYFKSQKLAYVAAGTFLKQVNMI